MDKLQYMDIKDMMYNFYEHVKAIEENLSWDKTTEFTFDCNDTLEKLVKSSFYVNDKKVVPLDYFLDLMDGLRIRYDIVNRGKH